MVLRAYIACRVRLDHDGQSVSRVGWSMGRESRFSTKNAEYISWERAESRTPLKEATS